VPKKIACLGSAPSSIRFAPFDDASWTIFGCSPALYPLAKRVDAWFELHRWEPPIIGNPQLQVPWFSPEYCQWLRQLKAPVYMAEPVADIPTSVAYPIRPMIEKYGPYLWTSSLAYMFILALEQPDIQEIGMWGVDMAATEEYRYQRPALQFLIQHAMQRGIKVTLPPESDLLQPMPLYGVDECTPMAVKFLARKKELSQRLADAQAQMANCQRTIDFLAGAIDDVNYVLDSWTSTALQGTPIKTVDRVVYAGEKFDGREPPLPDVLGGIPEGGIVAPEKLNGAGVHA
jgi:hypothetical protein